MVSPLLILTSLAVPIQLDTSSFQAARPIWLEDRDTEMNVFAGFRAVIEPPVGERVVLRLTASTIYRAKVNGRFVGHGPARGPRGFYRVDEWDLGPYLKAGRNVVAVEVAGYNANSYYLFDQPSFVQAEVLAGCKVLASTAGDGAPFEAAVLTERVQKVQRYSFQRPFSEAYRLKSGFDQWQIDPDIDLQNRERERPAQCVTRPTKALLPRRVPYPRFELKPAVWHVAQGTVKVGELPKKPLKDRSLTGISEKLKGYQEKDLETIPSVELQAVANADVQPVDRAFQADARLAMKANTFNTLDLGTNLTGFLGATIECREKTRLFLTFDEVLTEGDVDFLRMQCVNIIELNLEPGTCHFETIEPYTMRYIKPIVLAGDCTLSNIHLREYVNPETFNGWFAASDDRFNRLFEAARQTFAQNAVDVFMDCPSRERAGWLCDSFFTARAAVDFTGRTTVERNMMENYTLPPSFPHLPEGMLPMCYPADHCDGVFIPNWAMWFVVQLDEYLQRSDDRATVDALEPRVMKLLEYFKPFENSDGLLEKLQSWVFVEWSAAAQFVQDVNYPSNALYAGTLAAVGRLYNKPDLTAKAERIRETIRKQSYDGQFFVDNAIRKDGRLETTRNRSEACQYYLFFFDVATPERYPALWKTLHTQFGPQRQQTKAFPEIHVANSFIGNVLRLELLSRYGLIGQLLDESVDYHLYMADRTGTLWENTTDHASCNHGFASHLGHVFIRDVLGLYAIDPVGKSIRLRLATDLKLDWCRGRVLTPDGPVSLHWWKAGSELRYRLDAPAGYRVETIIIGEKQPVRQP